MKNSIKRYRKPKITVEKIEINFFNSRRYSDSFSLIDGLTGEILAGCPNSCGCFLPGTPVTLADGRIRKIEKIKPKDLVVSYDTTNQHYVKNSVNELLIHSFRQYKYYIINYLIKVTGNHRVWVNNLVWKRVDELKIGDRLLTKNFESIVVNSLERQIIKTKVYNLHLNQAPHTFFAANILAHNSSDLGTAEKEVG